MTKSDVLFWTVFWLLVGGGLWLLDMMARMAFTLQTI